MELRQSKETLLVKYISYTIFSHHFTLQSQIAEEIAFRIKYFFGKYDNGDDIFPDMEDLTNGDNYTSPDKRMMVINKEVNSISDPI